MIITKRYISEDFKKWRDSLLCKDQYKLHLILHNVLPSLQPLEEGNF